MNGTNSAWKLYQWLIRKKSCLGQMGQLGPRMLHPVSQLWISFKDCFTILHNESGQERHGNLMVFPKEILFRVIWSFWNKNGMMSS